MKGYSVMHTGGAFTSGDTAMDSYLNNNLGFWQTELQYGQIPDPFTLDASQQQSMRCNDSNNNYNGGIYTQEYACYIILSDNSYWTQTQWDNLMFNNQQSVGMTFIYGRGEISSNGVMQAHEVGDQTQRGVIENQFSFSQSSVSILPV